MTRGSPDIHKKFSAAEKKMWQYHKMEIRRVSATLTDLSQEEAGKVVKSIEETYGKVYLLWDPRTAPVPSCVARAAPGECS